MPDNDNKKQYEIEWEFSFENLGESIAQLMHQLGIGNDADLQTQTLTERLGNAERAQLRLDLTVGYTSIKALDADSENLIEADVTSIGAVEMTAITEGRFSSVRLRQKRSTDESDIFKPVKDAVDTVAHNTELKWAVRLSPNIPLNLELVTGVTVDEFDLTDLHIQRLKLDGGTGKTQLKLPIKMTNVSIKGGVGVVDIAIPDDAKATIEMDAGAGPTTINIGDANVKLTIEGGVGNCTIIIPPGAALQIMAESGLGNIIVPESCTPVKIESEFISESGRWQTAGYELSAKKIDIHYDGGVGSFVVQEREL